MFKLNASRKKVAALTFAAALALNTIAFGATALAQSSNFVYVTSTTQHFGDEPGALFGTYRGEDFDFSFSAPGVNDDLRAILWLRTRAVNSAFNVVRINGTTISGAITQHRDDTNDEWFTEMIDIPPNVLKATGNTLTIIARNEAGGAGGNLDDFVVDNIVVMYRTN